MASERADALPWRPKTGDVPTSPGVYRFQDLAGRVLYVGKAKNLRARLANYFQPLPRLHERTRRMVQTASSVEWTVVGSDVEALQLEYSLIKEYEPPFNVQFRDDKSYPSLAVTVADESPRVLITRNERIPGARYFGPYPKVWAVRETLDLMIRAFPIRTCNDPDYARAMDTGRPCFAGQIGRCGGPCSQKVTIAQHRLMVDRFIGFMSSHDRRWITELQREMATASEELDFERAAVLRDRIQALETVLNKSAVVLPGAADTDVFGIAHDGLSAAVQQFTVRGGRVRGVRSWVVDTELDVSLGELVESVIETAYDRREPPRELVVPTRPDGAEALETWLGSRRARGSVALKVGVRGDRASVLRTATLNAQQALLLHTTRRSADYTARTQALNDLAEALGLPEAPLRIEGYDVSHLGLTGVVASMVVFEDGLPRKGDYRKFAVADGLDDLSAMSEVLRRRLLRLREDVVGGGVSTGSPDGESRRFAYRPGLILVDGGQPQVEAAARVMEELGITGVPLAGLAKRLEELWLPGNDYPVILPRSSEALFLVQRLRDEAHRFAITFQRQKRRASLRTELEDIPGLGPARIQGLLRRFGSVKRLRAATVEDIAETKGIGPALAAAIVARLAPNPTERRERSEG